MEIIEVKTSELIGPALDWAVAKAQGWKMVRVPKDVDGNFCGEVLAPPDFSSDFKFPNRGRVGASFFLRRWSTDWSWGGPLIDQFKIGFALYGEPMLYFAVTGINDLDIFGSSRGETHLIASCRAIVIAKLGAIVSVPNELMQ